MPSIDASALRQELYAAHRGDITPITVETFTQIGQNALGMMRGGDVYGAVYSLQTAIMAGKMAAVYRTTGFHPGLRPLAVYLATDEDPPLNLFGSVLSHVD